VVTALVSTLPAKVFQATELPGYRIASVHQAYGGVRQRWLVVESEARRQADLVKLEHTLAKATAAAQRQLARLQRQDFACAADTLVALEQLANHLPWHDLTDRQVTAQAHYDRRGKPQPGAGELSSPGDVAPENGAALPTSATGGAVHFGHQCPRR